MTTDTTAPVLLQERIGDVLLLTLNRPEKHNALNAAVHHWLGDAVARAPEEGVKVIVLTGAGEKSFCSGGYMAEMTGLDQNQTPLPPKEERKNGTIEIANTPLPVIAAINGYCYGGGLRLALVCDIRLASSNATFRSPGAEYGLVVGASMLPRLVGASTAKEWIFTTRVFDAEEARAAGLVSSPLHEPGKVVEAALEMAQVIAGHSAAAVQNAKRVVDMASLEMDAVRAETEINNELRKTDEQAARFREGTRRVTGR